MKPYNFTNPLFLFKIKFMTRHLYVLLLSALFMACNDGDILTVDLAFDQQLKRCDNNISSYLLYDTRTDPNESLTLLIPRTDDTQAFFTNPTEAILDINGSTVRFNYRTYNINPDGLLCDDLANSDLVIREDFEATTGRVYINSSIVDDDNDGIPSIYEYGPGGLANPRDSDGDGIPDYLDEDDDNDNVKTRNEIIVSTGDDPPFILIDTDGDGIPDYLDDDDDGDGVLTILEDENGINGPFDDSIINSEGIVVKRYLSTEATDAFPNPGYISNTFRRVVTTAFRIEDIDLEILRSTQLDFGTFISTFNITTNPD